MRATSFAEKLEKHSIPEPNTGCHLWTGGYQTSGYGAVSYSRDGIKYWKQAHRFSWEVQRGPIPEEMQVCHKCDNPACVNVEHLFLGTNSDNMRDAVAKGRHGGRKRRGENHPLAKLSDAQALEIRSSLERGVDLAKRYGVSPATICVIRRGTARRHNGSAAHG